MKAVDVDMSARVNVRTIEDKLSVLCGNDTEDDEEEDDDWPHRLSHLLLEAAIAIFTHSFLRPVREDRSFFVPLQNLQKNLNAIF